MISISMANHKAATPIKRVQGLAKRLARPLQHLFGGVVLACLLSASMATRVHAQSGKTAADVDQYNAHDLEVKIDRLPDEIAAADIEMVVEASDSRCKPKPVKLLGISVPAVPPAATSHFCGQLEAYLGKHPGPIPMQLSRKDWTFRKVADQVQNLDVPLARRYVLLSIWRQQDSEVDAYATVRKVRWVVEEALWDRDTRAVLWHSLRNIYWDDHYEGGKVWGAQIELRRHFAFRLPANLMHRALVRQHAPVPGGRWVPAADVESWQSETKAAIGFVNTHIGNTPRTYYRGISFPIRAESQPRYLSERHVWGEDESMRKENIPILGLTPPFDIRTYGLLEVPPGRYVVDVSYPEGHPPIILDLKAGQTEVVEYSRAFFGPDVPKVADVETLRKAMVRGPHAFLQDSRVLSEQWQVQTWFTER